MDEFTTCKWCGDLLTNHTQERLTACDECLKKDYKADYWSKDGQIFYHYGKGYGLSLNLRTVCIGTEEEVKKKFVDVY